MTRAAKQGYTVRANTTGFTLIEALIVLSLIGLTAFFLQPRSNFLEQTILDKEVNQLLSFLQSARHYAVSSGLPVRVCPINDDGSCRNDFDSNDTSKREQAWSSTLGLFVFRNSNLQRVSTLSAITKGFTRMPTSDRKRIDYQSDGGTGSFGFEFFITPLQSSIPDDTKTPECAVTSGNIGFLRIDEERCTRS